LNIILSDKELKEAIQLYLSKTMKVNVQSILLRRKASKSEEVGSVKVTITQRKEGEFS
jgi:hypothetical protein